jgi:CHAT domain-containing protein/tetratricopeptide (TPR) repeat protein
LSQDSSSNKSLDRYSLQAIEFISKLLQFFIDGKDDCEIQNFMKHNSLAFDNGLLDTFIFLTIELLRNTKDPDRINIAFAVAKFGSLIARKPIASNDLNHEFALASFLAVLEVWSEDTDPNNWATAQENLGKTYANRVKGERGENLQRAVEAYEKALTVRKSYTVEWANTLRSLADIYCNLPQANKAESIEKAIGYYQEVLKVYTLSSFPGEWAQTQNNLANAYGIRVQGDLSKNIEKAIDIHHQALTIRTKVSMPKEWAISMMNLGNSYYVRIQGDLIENIEKAIQHYQQALSVQTKSLHFHDWLLTMNSLGSAYSKRLKGDYSENIEKAIKIYEQILEEQSKTESPLGWAQAQHNIGTAYFARVQGNRAKNIRKAINSYHSALEIISQTTMLSTWITIMVNLSLAYSEQIEGDKSENIELSIATLEKALKAIKKDETPVDWAHALHNLATLYVERIFGNKIENINKAIGFCQQATIIFKANHIQLPEDCRRTAKLLGGLLVKQSHYKEASEAYQLALQAADLVYQNVLMLSNQEIELSKDKDLFRRAAFAFAKSGDYQKAVVTLERGRARSLSKALKRDRTELTAIASLDSDLYNSYQQVAREIRQLETAERFLFSSNIYSRSRFSQEELSQRSEKVYQNFNEVISSIRKLPRHEKFLKQVDFDDIVGVVEPDSSLVYLNVTPDGSSALIVRSVGTKTSISSILIDSFTQVELGDLLANQADPENAFGWLGDYISQKSSSESWQNKLEIAMERVWHFFMEPIVRFLECNGIQKAILIPTGLLIYIPLHAAWKIDASKPVGRHYAMDSVEFSYSPNALSLRFARQIKASISNQSLLAIQEPQPTTAPSLPNSKQEIEVAVSFFPNCQVLEADQATRENTLSTLPTHSVLHFAGHGFFKLDVPLESGLLLAGDEVLSLQDILNLQLKGIRLAILSACETGLAGAKLLDEVFSLPTGLLQAGTAGVVASLWSVHDLSTTILLTRFYQLWRQDGLEPASALRLAQQWVRDTTNGEKVAYFQGFLPGAFAAKMPGSSADYLYKQLILSRPEARDFAHPFHWAAFSYTGV